MKIKRLLVALIMVACTGTANAQHVKIRLGFPGVSALGLQAGLRLPGLFGLGRSGHGVEEDMNVFLAIGQDRIIKGLSGFPVTGNTAVMVIAGCRDIGDNV